MDSYSLIKTSISDGMCFIGNYSFRDTSASVVDLAIAEVATALLMMDVIEPRVTAATGVLGISLIGASSAGYGTRHSKNGKP